MTKITGVCFGEVLFDIFQKYENIGGAPLNVAVRMKSFGIDVAIISAVGNDNRGKKIVHYLDSLKVKTTNTIQIKENYPTGLVNVILNEKGNANYDIVYPSAWDRIKLTKDNKTVVKNSDFLIYGSLTCRDLVSKKTLFELVELAKYKIFDVNLRVPHYTQSTLLSLMQSANFIKFNDEELYEICQYIGLKYNNLEHSIRFISKETNTEIICVTKGSHGAVLYYEDRFYYNSGYRVKVLDTVGAGDSFLAALIVKLLVEADPQKEINFSCSIGALVAKKEGANPEISEIEIRELMSGG